MNKIIKIKLNIERIKHKGGNSKSYKTPLNVDNHYKIIKMLSLIKPYSRFKTFFLINKKTKTNIPKYPSVIPAPRKRFDEDIKFIFGENKLFYETTFYSRKKENLIFMYLLSYDQIEEAIKRLKLVNKFLNNKLMNNLSNIFNKENKEKIRTSINYFAKENDLKNFSYQKIIAYLSNQCYILKSFDLSDKTFSSNGKETEELVFHSSEYANEGRKKLLEQNLNVEKTKYSDKVILVKGLISKERNFQLEGLISQNKNKLPFLEKATESFLKKININLKSHEMDSIIGIIDGGIGDGVVKDKLWFYEDSISLGINEKLPTGNHAEQVASIAMFAKQLSNKTNDNLKNPKVALFNVIHLNTNYFEFKNIIKKIIKQNTKIKIWNLSINFSFETSIFEISDLGVFLDKLQDDYNVIFIISTGNKNKNDKENRILPPADSFKAISVSSLNSKLEKTTYSREGRLGFHSFKPDTAIFGGDVGDEITLISKNLLTNSIGGSSFATPLISRLTANLYNEGFSLLEIPVILNAYSAWLSIEKNNKNIKYYPAGILQIDNTRLFNMLGNQLLTVSTISIDKHYKQGFMSFKFPKYENGYDFKFVLSININSELAKNSTFEYVLDAPVIKMGRVNPFENQKIINQDSNWIYQDKHEVRNDVLTETMQRIYKGKYKNRNTLISMPIRNRSSIKTKINEHKLQRDITNWGITLTRDMINAGSRENAKNQEIAIAIVASSKNKNFYNEFIRLNNEIILSKDLEEKQIIKLKSDNIIFDD